VLYGGDAVSAYVVGVEEIGCIGVGRAVEEDFGACEVAVDGGVFALLGIERG